MIRLIGVLSEGGVSVQVMSNMPSRGDHLLGALIEATKTLSSVLGSGQVMKLDFRDQKLIVTESQKGYSIVALVDRAEDYMDTLIRLIAEEIDESPVPLADGVVTDLHKDLVEAILNSYVRYEVGLTLREKLSGVWEPILQAIKKNPEYDKLVKEVNRPDTSDEIARKWEDFKSKIEPSIKDALWYARGGEYDKACAAAIGLEEPLAKIFAIKTGTLAFSMTETCAPPLDELKELAESLPNDPFSGLARSLVGRANREITPIDYAHAFQHAAGEFEVNDTDEQLMRAFLFIDPRIAEHEDLAKNLIEFFRQKNFEVICNYIEAVIERAAMFDKIYSMTTYDAFQSEFSAWKYRIAGTLELIDRVLNREQLRGVLTEGAVNQLGQNGSLQLQNYITLLTAMAESPVLSIGERRGILREVISIYRSYFRKLLETDVPLFAYTIDSVFQSLSVAYAEYYHLSSEGDQTRNLEEAVEFLRDILNLIDSDWDKLHDRLSLDVICNSLFPVLNMAGTLNPEEVKLALMAIKGLELRDTDALQVIDPLTFATTFGNIMSSLASLSMRILDEPQKSEVLKEALLVGLAIQEFFLTNGIVCRDDIIAVTFHASEAVEYLDNEQLRSVVRTITVLNRVSVQDPTKYDYEVAMMSRPYVSLLIRTWKKLGEERHRILATKILDTAVDAWRRYGFHAKAREFESEFKQTLT
ncbi:MAG: hypothetical protein RTU92_10210 [Candidatus Thorarchaeota archaeon]